MTTRDEVVSARRVVVKVGSSSLTTATGGIDPDRVRHLTEVLVAARANGTELVLVSSGAIAAGLAPLGLNRRPQALAAQQAAASVGQGLLVHRYTDELASAGDVHALIFEARVGDLTLQGLDLIRGDAGGRIAELTVMVRPASGLMALAERMGPALQAAGV